jgi:hypothetical protein
MFTNQRKGPPESLTDSTATKAPSPDVVQDQKEQTERTSHKDSAYKEQPEPPVSKKPVHTNENEPQSLSKKFAQACT